MLARERVFFSPVPVPCPHTVVPSRTSIQSREIPACACVLSDVRLAAVGLIVRLIFTGSAPYFTDIVFWDRVPREDVIRPAAVPTPPVPSVPRVNERPLNTFYTELGGSNTCSHVTVLICSHFNVCRFSHGV